MSLKTAYLYEYDVAAAASEVLDNVQNLFLAGYFEEALQIVQALEQLGPWQIGRFGNLYQRVEAVLPILCWVTKRGFPGIGNVPACSLGQLEISLKARGESILIKLLNAAGLRHVPAGSDWSTSYIVSIAAGERTLNSHACQDFFSDLEFILRERLRQRLDLPSVQHTGVDKVLQHLRPDIIKLEPPSAGDIGTGIAPEAQGIENALLINALTVLGRTSPPSEVEQRCWLMVIVADLHADRRAAVANHLRSALARSMPISWLWTLAAWKPLIELCATRLLARVLAIQEDHVAHYLTQFVTRQPGTIKPRPEPAKFEWEKALVLHTESFPNGYPTGRLRLHTPPSAGLRSMQMTGSLRALGADESSLVGLEYRLNCPLPSSYLSFLRSSNGLLVPNGQVNLLPLREVNWFYARHPEWIQTWCDFGTEVDDERYFTYGPDQDTRWIRTRYLNSVLQVSDSRDGDVILLNPEIRFGSEWEAWYFSNSRTGASRYRSFAELMQNEIFSPAKPAKANPLALPE